MADQSAHITETLPHGRDFPHTRASLVISRVLDRIGAAISWIWLLLLAVIVINVTLRYVFGEGRIEFEEIQWHLYAIGFLIGLSVCLDSDDHIRVSVLRDRLGQRARAWIELYGLLLLFFPFVALVLIYSVPFVAYSFSIAEVSSAPAGLGFRWAIKGVLFLGFALLALAGVGRLLRVGACLFGSPSPVQEAQTTDVD